MTLLDRPARHFPYNPVSGLVESLAALSPSSRSESRIPMRMFVKLYTPDGRSFELTPTIDVSCHGARVETRKRWEPEEQLLVRSIRGNLYSRARVAYCIRQAENMYAIGLELHFPSGDWTSQEKAPRQP